MLSALYSLLNCNVICIRLTWLNCLQQKLFWVTFILNSVLSTNGSVWLRLHQRIQDENAGAQDMFGVENAEATEQQSASEVSPNVTGDLWHA